MRRAVEPALTPGSVPFNDTAMRSRRGSRRAASVKLISGAGGVCASPAAGPRSASSNSAESSTVRASPPSTVRPCQCSASGSVEMRPRVGFSPNSPHIADGTRIEAPPSDPSPTGARPAATAAAVPPLEPPVERPVSHGLRVGPCARDSVM